MAASGASQLGQTTTSILIAVFILGVFAFYYRTKRPDGFPPGPSSLPIFGSFLGFGFNKSPHQLFRELHKKYGDIYSLKFAGQNTVLLNSAEVVKEAYVKHAVEFSGRGRAYAVGLLTEGFKDIIFSDGPQWKYQRKLAHSVFRQFTQRKQMERLVHDVTPKIASVLDAFGDKPFAPKWTVCNIVYNILATFTLGKKYELNDPEIMTYIDLRNTVMYQVGNGQPADYLPILKYIPIPSVLKFKRLLKSFHRFFYNEFNKHRERFDPENVGDLFDLLILKQSEEKEAGEDQAGKLTDTHIVQIVMDLLIAGTDTAIHTLHWAIAAMTEHPKIQEKVAMEIDEVVGRDRLPSIDDKGTLPYTEATILEVFRFGSVVPIGIPHSVMADTSLCGYKIPKGTSVMINHLALHYNPRDWAEPNKFKPEHFLKANGELLTKLPESFLPFSCGRRSCLGEDFAKKEIFLLFTWLFSRYTFYKVPGKEMTSLLTATSNSAFNHQPRNELQVCVKRRF
ncbi:cytochrome P450 2J4-like [Asterias amurensis]|uniref:cytochrome P450 2J4-like n=1 Tax=Asterias amurensis TaxID=7602 RepID=UPI003AB324B5